MELSNFAFHEELGVLQEELPNYFLEEGELVRKCANGNIQFCTSQEKGIE